MSVSATSWLRQQREDAPPPTPDVYTYHRKQSSCKEYVLGLPYFFSHHAYVTPFRNAVPCEFVGTICSFVRTTCHCTFPAANDDMVGIEFSCR